MTVWVNGHSQGILEFSSSLHPHAKRKRGTLSDAIGFYRDIALRRLDQLLNYCEAKADPFAVDFGCPLKFSKTCEKGADVLGSDTNTRIFYLYLQQVEWEWVI